MDNLDKLTGLLNFDEFVKVTNEMISRVEEKDTLFVVISTDFSKFKDINKTYGYAGGNTLITRLSEIFTGSSDCACACRPYSDHIIGLFRYSADECWPVKQQELISVQADFCDEYKPLFPRISIHLNTGVYIISDHSEDMTSCIDKANIARRSVKGNYRVPYAIYTEEMQKRKEIEAKIIPLFEKALENESILVYFQPKINVKKGTVRGAEALTRLLDEEGKIIPPDIFIPVLENSGKVLDLDRYVMRYVFKKIKEWTDEGKRVVPVSINLSKLHFYYQSLVESIISEFDRYDISPDYVEFEVTESVFFEEHELLIDKIEKLREHGFKVSVDDFGSGYSSLNLIGILPVDIIKLDKGFIKNSLNNNKGKNIIKGLIQILNEIEMEIVCEGIENSDDEQIVYEFGCEVMQGYLYDKPIPVNEFESRYVFYY